MRSDAVDLEALVAEALGGPLPAPIDDAGLEARVRAAVASSGRVVVALDDDPTGVQTVHDTFVLATWEREALRRELARRAPLFFVLTNSRSLPEAPAARLNRDHRCHVGADGSLPGRLRRVGFDTPRLGAGARHRWRGRGRSVHRLRGVER